MKQRTFFIASLFTATLAACAAPFVAVDFTEVEDGVVSSAQRNLTLHMDDEVKIVPGGPTGTPYVQFDGSSATPVRINAQQASSKLKGDEVAVSFWFRADRIANCPIAFGFSMKTDFRLSEAPLTFNMPTKPTDFGTVNLWARLEGNSNTMTRVWHHAAFLYSISNNVFTVWVDGYAQRDVPLWADEPSPVNDLFGMPFAKSFAGAIADICVWNYAATPAEIMEMKVSSAEKKATSDAFTAAAAAPNATSSFKKWCAEMAERAGAFGETGNVRDWMLLQKARWDLPKLTRLATGTTEKTLDDAAILPIAIYPYHWEKRLPFRMPEDGAPCNVLPMRAALGEFEGTSFMAYPYKSGTFFIEPTDLTGPGGAKFPASMVDIRTVKVWFSHASGWLSYFGGGKEFPVLTPEILLHDDAMVKVVREKRKNYLRISDPDGDRYVDISQYGTTENMETFQIGAEPVHDAKTFRPMPVVQGDLSQFWITVHIPKDAVPGDYTGSLAFSLDGKPAGSLPLTIRVYPFKLPRGAPRYNIDEKFLGTWYNHIGLPNKLGGGHYGGDNSLSNACRRLLAELKNMGEHNMPNPFGSAYGDAEEEDLSDIYIGLMKAAGIETDPIKGDLSAHDGDWCTMGRRIQEFGGDISVEAHPELFAQCMTNYTNRCRRVMNKLREKLGHTNAYCYGMDEAGPGTVRREMPFFATLQHFGGKAYISMCVAEWVGFMADFDNIPAHIGRTVNRSWHEAGCRVGTYAAPFSGPENPEIWRRSMGLRIYMANFDGDCNYNWYEAFNCWNNFVADGSRYGNFCIVYPTKDGVVDTVGWEAQREGLDDVRYLTLLRRLAREAMRSDKRELQRLGRRNYAWAELIDPECVELDDMRAEAADRIIKLGEALKDVNTERLYE